ncbi:MAG: recombinase family protein, partial [Pseudomonadota bacterium]
MPEVNGSTTGEPTKRRKIRCAIYTRKSSEEGLDQDFNSLDAQREACAAYIASQKHEGWVLLPGHYDDGGISGGTLERPGLQQLMTDIDDGLVDQIIVYKIDRLTRSLPDFAKLVDRLDAAEASFVSVTQSFNTATSMGRLMLNMLLSFAQFERKVTSERIRDKIAASKKRGLWMGGIVPLGYEADGRSLMINEAEAQIVRKLFELYNTHKNIRLAKEEADRLQLRPKPRALRSNDAAEPFKPNFSRGHIQFILSNPIYAGRIRHKQKVHQGLHAAIIDPQIWDEVQELLVKGATRSRGTLNRSSHKSLLAGKLFDETGDRLTPSHANKKGQRYHYYVSHRLITNTANSDKQHSERANGWRLPAHELERTICRPILNHLKAETTNGLFKDADVDLIQHAQSRIAKLENTKSHIASSTLSECIETAVIKSDAIELTLDALGTAKLFEIAESSYSRRKSELLNCLQDEEARGRDETNHRKWATFRDRSNPSQECSKRKLLLPENQNRHIYRTDRHSRKRHNRADSQAIGNGFSCTRYCEKNHRRHSSDGSHNKVVSKPVST